MQKPGHEMIEKDINNIMTRFDKVVRAINLELPFLTKETDFLQKKTLLAIKKFRITFHALFNNTYDPENLALYMLQKLVYHYAIVVKSWDFKPAPCSILEDGILSHALRYVSTRDAQRFSQGLSNTMDIDVENILGCIPEDKAIACRALFAEGFWKPKNPYKEAPRNSLFTRNSCAFYPTLTQPSFEFKNLNGCFVDFITGNARISPMYAGGFRFRAMEAHQQLRDYMLEKQLHADNVKQESETSSFMGFCSIS